MRIEDFSEGQRRNLTKTAKGAWAYLPPPLPPSLDYGQLALKLATASQSIGELNGAARRLPNPYMLVDPLIRKEALTSSAMEGTFTTLEGILLQVAAPEINLDDDAREAFNYMVALKVAVEYLKKLPISHRIIKDAHANLLRGLSPRRGQGKRPGEYKTSQNAIGKTGDSEESARYVPPPPAETQVCMDQLEAFINRENRPQGLDLIDLALAHYQFEAIHPFADGNGRIGRLLITLTAQQMGLTALPLLHVSAIIENQKEQYIDLLYRVSTENKWEEWICFFLEIVSDSCRDAIRLADEALALQSKLRTDAVERGGNHRLGALVDSLFIKPNLTISEAQKTCSVSYPTAKSDVEQLVKIGVLTQINAPRPAQFFAPQIWNLAKRRPTN